MLPFLKFQKSAAPQTASQHHEQHVHGNGIANATTINNNKNENNNDNTKRPLTQKECKAELAYAFPTWKKWMILTVIFLVQLSMNLNTTLYSNGIAGMAREFQVDEATAVWGAAAFLIAYAFGCELWAPWSEEFGRRWVLQLSLGLVGLCGAATACAPNMATMLAFRALGGLVTAGGSVTLAVVTDLFDHRDPWYQYATLFLVFASVGGSIVGPIAGGFVEVLMYWRSTLWISVVFGGAVHLLHFFLVPETRTTVMMDKIAKKWRKSGRDTTVYGPGELAEKRINWAETGKIWMRPFKMLVTEPIVLVLSLLSGFSDALVFMQIQSFTFIYKQWDFGPIEIGYAFLPLLVGYILATLAFVLAIRRNHRNRTARPTSEHAQYEDRLWALLWMAPALPLGLLLFAFTTAWSTQEPVHWIGSMVATCLIGIANLAVYMASIDFVLRTYGEYAASATGGNGWARDFLAGVLTPAALPLYRDLGGPRPVFAATMLLFAVSVVLCLAVVGVYVWGPVLRRRSRLAQTLADQAAEEEGEDAGTDGREGGSKVSVAVATVSEEEMGEVRDSMDLASLHSVALDGEEPVGGGRI